MENIVYNELSSRGYNVDVGVVEVYEPNNSGKSILTKESLRDYMSLYLSKPKDYNNKFVNLLKNNWLFNYPKTIIITGTQDPLHDEGVELKNKLERFSVYVNHLDIENAKHGFLTSIIDQKYTDNTIEFLKKYL